jgi:hypothetical protein
MAKEIFTQRVPVARSDTVHASGISSDNSITPHMTVSTKHTDLQHFSHQFMCAKTHKKSMSGKFLYTRSPLKSLMKTLFVLYVIV